MSRGIQEAWSPGGVNLTKIALAVTAAVVSVSAIVTFTLVFGVFHLHHDGTKSNNLTLIACYNCVLAVLGLCLFNSE